MMQLSVKHKACVCLLSLVVAAATGCSERDASGSSQNTNDEDAGAAPMGEFDAGTSVSQDGGRILADSGVNVDAGLQMNCEGVDASGNPWGAFSLDRRAVSRLVHDYNTLAGRWSFVSSFEYDADNRLIRVDRVDSRNGQALFDFEYSEGRLEKVRKDGEIILELAYRSDGVLQSKTNLIDPRAISTFEFEYDELGRLTFERVIQPAIIFEYTFEYQGLKVVSYRSDTSISDPFVTMLASNTDCRVLGESGRSEIFSYDDGRISSTRSGAFEIRTVEFTDFDQRGGFVVLPGELLRYHLGRVVDWTGRPVAMGQDGLIGQEVMEFLRFR